MMKMENYCILPKNLLPFCLWLEPSQSLRFLNDVSLNLPQNCKCTGIICSIPNKPRWCSPMRSFTASVSLNHGASSLSEGDHLSNDNIVSEGTSENHLPQKLGTDELNSLLLDSERSRLLKKLSEANQHNRFLKRQLQIKDDALVSLTNELTVLELESQMSSGGGDEPPRRSFTSQVYRKAKLLATKGRGRGRDDSTTPPPSAALETVPSTFSSYEDVSFTPQYQSTSQQADLQFPTAGGYYYFPGPPPTAQYHAGASISQTPPVAPSTDKPDSRMLIAPDGDTFYPSSQPTHKVRDIIRSRFDAPYISWKKIPLNVRDMWFREFEKDFRWLSQHHERIRKFFEKRGSTRLRDMFTDIRKKDERPLWIGEDVWSDLYAAWGTPEYVQKRAQNKGNRASDSAGMGTSLHTGGSIPHTEHRRRLEKSLGRQPTVLEVHTRTHQRQETQEWITPKAQKAYDDYIQLSQSQSSAGEGASSSASCRRSDYDLWTEAIGGVQKGRIYGLGTEAGSYRSQGYTPTYTDDLEDRLKARCDEIQAQMTLEVNARFTEINESIKAGFERMSPEMHHRAPPTEPIELADEATESDRDT